MVSIISAGYLLFIHSTIKQEVWRFGEVWAIIALGD
jgi:hypothetical protein